MASSTVSPCSAGTFTSSTPVPAHTVNVTVCPAVSISPAAGSVAMT